MLTITHFLNLLLASLLLLLLVRNAQAQYEDARCKCACQVDTSKNSSSAGRRNVIRTVPAEKCNCKMMFNDLKQCPQCECKYQSRNTTTIKVVVCLIIVVISALTLYMLILLLLEPLARRRRGGISIPQMGQPGVPRTSSLDDRAPLHPPEEWGRQRSRSDPVSEVVSRARDQQKKWKGNVEAQRERVYNEHSILN